MKLNNIQNSISCLTVNTWRHHCTKERCLRLGRKITVACVFSGGNLKERGNMEDLGVDGRILKWILRNSFGKVWTGLFR